MADASTDHAPRIRDRLAGRHILVTGSTGFLAKSFLEKLLRAVDTLDGIHLLVRPRPDGTPPRKRFFQEVLRSRAFDRLRASLGERFEKLCEEKIQVVGGDLTQDRLGMDTGDYEALTRRVDLVVNSAATVTFDERMDWAIELNALGPGRLLQFAKDCGDAPFLHVSTCYVCGARTGVVVEDFSAPEPARESLPRLADSGAYDLDGLIHSLREDVARVVRESGGETEAARRNLIDAGMKWARRYGWNDTYTFTKWIGEQLLIRDRGSLPLVVFRPAIIEGSFDEPTPGWIDGLRMADPIIVAYGRGKLADFPARSEIPIDLIPVDFVANAMIATLPVGAAAPPAGVGVYQCGSSERHPFLIGDLRKSLERAFALQPMIGDDGRPIRPGRLRFVERERFLRRWRKRRRSIARYQQWLQRLGLGGKKSRKLAAAARQVDQLLYFSEIYSPYTHLDCRFADDNLRAAAERLHPADRRLFPFDVDGVDWDDYIVNRHVPGVRAFALGSPAEPTARIRGVAGDDDGRSRRPPLPAPGSDLFSAFRAVAERFPHKHSVQIRRNGRWVRYTYDEALRATGTIMHRLSERGLQPGDRVALYSENGPEWGLTYLGILRAGMTAVPMDPQWAALDVVSAARFAGVKLICAAPKLWDQFPKSDGRGSPEAIPLNDALIPPPGASRDRLPEPIPVPDSNIASILFTSGTTVSPRAVPLTHANLLANAAALLRVHPIDFSDEFLSVLPTYHAFEFTAGFLVPMMVGATVTYVEQLKGAEILSSMRATGTTIMLVVPRLLRSFRDSIESGLAAVGFGRRMAFRVLGALSSWTGHRYARKFFQAVHASFGGRLRMFVCGGSRLEPELFHSFRRLGFPVYEGYGLTETSPVLSVCLPGEACPGSVGPPLPNVELDVRHPNAEGIGEIWVRGPSVMQGYLDNPAANQEVMVDGWFRTGDLARFDAEGRIHLTGRCKDLIVTGAGKNVYPDEVEAKYEGLPHVKEICVFGAPSPDGLGDQVHAVVVIEESAAPDLDRSSIEREIRAAAAGIGENLPSHQRIAAIHFWDRELPKTSTLKAKRSLIKSMVFSETMGGPAKPTDESVRGAESGSKGGEALANPSRSAAMNHFAHVAEILSKQSKRPAEQIHPDMHLLLDLGIDSIGKIDVIGTVEAGFDMKIDDAAAAKIARVSDLLAVIGDRRPVSTGSRVGDAWRRLVGSRPDNGFPGSVSVPLIPARWVAQGSLSLFMSTYVRVRAQGRENIPSSGPFVLAANHSSHLDGPAVLTAVGSRRRIWIAGAEDYFFTSPLRRFVYGRLFDTIPFDRQADGVLGLRRCDAALAHGDGLLLFPEGTRSRTGCLQPFKVGAALLAVERNAPVIPVCIDNSFDLLPKGNRVIRPGVVTVQFGEPIFPDAVTMESDKYAAIQGLTAKIQAAVMALNRKVRG